MVIPCSAMRKTQVGPAKLLALGIGRSVLCGGVALALLGCDEKPAQETKPAPPPEAAPVTPPTPAPAPEPEPEAKTPTKKLEDCEKGKVALGNSEVEAHLRMKAQKPEGDLTTADLGKITSVNFSRLSLDTLDTCIFHHMKSLKEVFLGPGKVWDLSPLAGLSQLETVRVAGNPVEELAPLAGLKKMDRLDISDTKIKDLSPVAGWTLLTEVTLDGSAVEDISALSGAKGLQVLSIKRTKIKDLSPLKDSKKLEQLFIAESAIASDIAATGVVHQNGTKVIQE
jgi:internalin A